MWTNNTDALQLLSAKPRPESPSFYRVRGLVVQSQGRYLKWHHLCASPPYWFSKVAPSVNHFREDENNPCLILVWAYVNFHGAWNTAPRWGYTQTGTRWRAKDGVRVVSVPTVLKQGWLRVQWGRGMKARNWRRGASDILLLGSPQRLIHKMIFPDSSLGTVGQEWKNQS